MQSVRTVYKSGPIFAPKNQRRFSNFPFERFAELRRTVEAAKPGDEAIFGTTGVGTVTVDAGVVTATSMTFNTAGYTLGGGPITLDTGSIAQFVTNQNATINSAISFSPTTGSWFLGTVASGKTLTLGGNINAISPRDHWHSRTQQCLEHLHRRHHGDVRRSDSI